MKIDRTLPPTPRHLEFIGEHKNDSIVLGNYGDAKITAQGTFNLSGLIYCKKNTVEICLDGDGRVTFKGCCKRLLIQNISGQCVLDLSEFSCESVQCLSGKGNSVIILGRTKVIEQLILGNDAVLRYHGLPLMASYSLSDNAKIEQVTVAA